MEKRPPRNAIISQRRVAKQPSNPRYNPDLQKSIDAQPGFPPDTDGFIVSSFTGRFPLQEDFFYRIYNDTVVNGVFDDLAPLPNSTGYGLKAPPGFRLIVQHVYLPAIHSLTVSSIDGNNEVPFTAAGGITQIGVFFNDAVIPEAFIDGNPIASLLNYQSQLEGGTDLSAAALAFGPISVDCFARVESGSVFGIGFQTVNSGAPFTGNNFSYLFPWVELRGQIEAVDNYELQTLGLTKKPVPTSEAEGLRLLAKRNQGRNR